MEPNQGWGNPDVELQRDDSPDDCGSARRESGPILSKAHALFEQRPFPFRGRYAVRYGRILQRGSTESAGTELLCGSRRHRQGGGPNSPYFTGGGLIQIILSWNVLPQNLVGSTTACLAVLRDDELRIANLGDCGVLVVRGQGIIFRTAEQQHSFNFPFQLGTGSKDSPSDAETFTVKVKEGDIVIVASDGLFDNLFDDEILEIAVSMTETARGSLALDPQKLADTLALRCREGGFLRGRWILFLMRMLII